MKKIFLTAIGILLLATGVQAGSTINFTSQSPTDFSLAKDQRYYEFNNVNNLGFVNLTVYAGAFPTYPVPFVTPPPVDADAPTIWWDGTDGFGVQYSYEGDEVESIEILLLSFETPVVLNSIGISDLFIESRSGVTYAEEGYYQLGGPDAAGPTWFGSWITFVAQQPTGTNGELWIGDIDTTVSWIAFMAPGILKVDGINQDHEFAVQKIEVSQVPVPPALLLLGSGILGLAAVRRRMKS